MHKPYINMALLDYCPPPPPPTDPLYGLGGEIDRQPSLFIGVLSPKKARFGGVWDL